LVPYLLTVPTELKFCPYDLLKKFIIFPVVEVAPIKVNPDGDNVPNIPYVSTAEGVARVCLRIKVAPL
jgi:hypothetical protein